MKRTIISLLVVAAALFSSMPAWGQVVHSPDGTEMSYDNLILGRRALKWEFEGTIRQVAGIGYMPEYLTLSLRKGYKAFGIGAGHKMMTYDAYPATVYSIPFYAYSRYYIPVGESGRFLLFTDEFLGYDAVYKVRGDSSFTGTKKGDGNFFISWQPGIAIRTRYLHNVFMGLAVTTDLSFKERVLFGLHLGISF